MTSHHHKRDSVPSFQDILTSSYLSKNTHHDVITRSGIYRISPKKFSIDKQRKQFDIHTKGLSKPQWIKETNKNGLVKVTFIPK